MSIKLYKIIFSAILVFPFYSNYAQERTIFQFKKNERLNANLLGKVKQLRVNIKNSEDNEPDSLVYDFDISGNPLKIINFRLGVDIIERKFKTEEIHYDFKNGKLISKLNKINNDIDGEIYEYDEHWNVVLEKMYMKNTLIKEILSEYNEKNRLTKNIEYLYGGFSGYNEKTQEGKEKYLYQVDEFKYDKIDNLLIKTSKNFRKNFTEKRIYKYDANKNKIEEGQCFTSNDEKDCNYKPLFGFEYNSQNKLIKEFQLAKFSPHNTDQYYLYDTNGNEIESKGYYIYPGKEPILGYHFKYEYNEFEYN